MNTAEEKARELYPDKEYPDVFGLNMEQLHERSIEHQQILIQRKAFLKGYEYANQQLEVDYQKMFANCSLPNEKQPEQVILKKRPNRKDYIGKKTKNQLIADLEMHIDYLESTRTQDNVREAAEFLLERIKKDRDKQRFSVRLALTELEKALK